MPKKEARGNQVTPSGPLHDVNVLDLGTAGVGPWAATLLGYLGARVIKLENPAGDRIRIQKPFINGVSTTYTVLNLNKKTSILDLKDQNLAEARDRLVGQADVAMDNVRPGLLERLALGYQRLKEINPNIVAVSSPAWGEEGPMRTLAGFDFQVQMFSGYASLNGRPGEVGQMARYPHLDFNAACFLASSALLGLIARERTHKGQRLVASHLGSALVLQLTRFAEYFATGQNPSPMGSASAASVPHQAFKSQNGAYVLVGVENEGQWQGFCTAIQHGELAQEPRFASNRQRVAHRQELIPILEKVFASKPARWWIFRLEGENVPCGYIHSFEDLRFHQHILENQFMKKIEVPHQLPIYVGGEPWVLEENARTYLFCPHSGTGY